VDVEEEQQLKELISEKMKLWAGISILTIGRLKLALKCIKRNIVQTVIDGIIATTLHIYYVKNKVTFVLIEKSIGL
jgi:hypothetical protein